MAVVTVVHRIEFSEDAATLLREIFGGNLSHSTVDILNKLYTVGGKLDRMIDEESKLYLMLQEVQDTMAATKEELSAALTQIVEKVQKIGDDLVANFENISAQIAAGNDVSTQLAQATEIANRLQTIDDTIPERILPPPPPPEGGGTAPPEGGGGGNTPPNS